jgi:uncharacterized protein YceK
MKTRIKNFNKFFWLSFPILLAVFCSGCRTVGEHAFPSYPSVGPLYKGTCGDAQSIGSVFKKDKDFSVMARIGVGAFCCLDLPLSFGADTLWFPFDLYDYHLQIEEANLLKGWTFKYFDNDYRIHGYTTNRFEQGIINDYENFAKQNGLDIVSVIYGHHEDGKGQYAVDFDAGVGHDVFHYFLFYDKDGKRIKAKKYLTGHVSC